MRIFASMESKILKGLNKAQYDAVVNYDSPSLIIAGAGSGKTRVLTSRIAYMLEQGVKPWNILALTFTNKAARQMRERIEQMVDGSASHYIRMGTFHSVFSRILRENAERIGYPQTFTIYEPNDCKNLIKTICKEQGLADDKYKPQRVLSRISYAKNALITPGAYVANTSFAAEDRQMQMPRFGEVYVEYCRRCKANGAMDFDDLLLQTNILLRDCPDVLAKYQEQFQYILVDEYQDTNYAQYIIIRRLSLQHGRVCVVGDDAQSIYSFRGAKIENILSFRNDYPTAQTFKLEQNYRSTQTIVNAANSVIERNSRRMDKKCYSEGEGGEKIRIMRCASVMEEARNIANEIYRLRMDTDESWEEFAILYRTNNQSKAIEEALIRRRIPYRVYKGSSFFNLKIVKDIVAYIRLIVNEKDDEAFKRVVNYPMRGIGDTTVQRIGQLAAQRGCSMWEAVDALVAEAATLGDPMQKTIARKVTEFVNLVRELKQTRDEKPLYDFGMNLVSRTGIFAQCQLEAQNTNSDSSEDGKSDLQNIETLLNGMKTAYDVREEEIANGEVDESEHLTIDEWLQNFMLLTDMDNEESDNEGMVTLMTVHSSKGLEYKHIYIAGCEERLFPSEKEGMSVDSLEEERRLFYVALTRAKSTACLSYCETRLKWGNMEFSTPSRFLREIDSRYVDCDEDLAERPQCRREPQEGGFTGRMGNFSRGAAPRGEERREGRTAIEALRQRFDYRFQQKREAEQSAGVRRQPDPRLVAPVEKPRSTEGLRRVVNAPAGAATSAQPCLYSVGDRVEHPTFGVGEIVRIESLATDHKLVVNFAGNEKTLLAKFAKLKKM